MTALINSDSALEEEAIQSRAIDALVRERLMLLDAVNEVLSRRVMDNYSDFVNGMSKVSELEEDLQITASVAQSCRHHLNLASNQVALGLQVAQQTRTKRTIINMVEMLVNIKNASLLKLELERLLENGDYYDAIVNCMECHEALEELPQEVSCTAELMEGLDELLLEAENRLGSSLEGVCREFNPDAYIKVYNGYLALNDPAALADKVVTCFTQSLLDTTQQVVRTFALQMSTSSTPNSMANGNDIVAKSRLPYNELCWQLPSVLIKSCIMKVLEVLFNIMESHEKMTVWHTERLQAGGASTSTGQLEGHEHDASEHTSASSDSDGGGCGGVGGGGETEAEKATSIHTASNGDSNDTASAAEESTLSGSSTNDGGGGGSSSGDATDEDPERIFHETVLESLRGCRRAIWDMAQQRIIKLIATPSVTEKGADFVTDDSSDDEAVLDWLFEIAHIGESFSRLEARPLRSAMTRQTATFFSNMHKVKLAQLRLSLNTESWHKMDIAGAHTSVSESGAAGPKLPPSLVTILERKSTSEEGGGGDATSSSQSAGPSSPRHASGDNAPVAADNLEDFASVIARGNPYIDSERAARPRRRDTATGRAAAAAAAAAAAEPPTGSASEVTVTQTSLIILTWWSEYCMLMSRVPGIADIAFQSLCQLFELYLLNVFNTFGAIHEGDGNGEEAGAGMNGAGRITPRLENVIEKLRSGEGHKLVGGGTWSAPGEDGSSGMVSTTSSSSSSGLSTLGGSGGGGVVGSGFKGLSRRLSLNKTDSSSSNTSEDKNVVSSANLYGLKERAVATESLALLAKELRSAHSVILRYISEQHKREQSEQGGGSDHFAPSTPTSGDHSAFFSRTLAAVDDLREYVYRSAARLILTLSWLPDRINASGGNLYNINDVPERQNVWVNDVVTEFKNFNMKLNMVTLSSDVLLLMWTYALEATAAQVRWICTCSSTSLSLSLSLSVCLCVCVCVCVCVSVCVLLFV